MALVIVLAFVVLLTGLIVAFFSTAVLDRQISNSSANATKVDLFAQGAVDTITADLRQEIAAGSNTTVYTVAGKPAATIYVPSSAAAAIPAQAVKGSQAAATSFAPNLLKRSAYGQHFFPTAAETGAAAYSGNTTVTIPLPSPAATPASAPAATYMPSQRAANVASTAPSQNGRYVSLARWNKPLLLPKATMTSDSDITPINPNNPGASPGATPPNFLAPDWVLVARDGTSPGSPALAAAYGTGGINDSSVGNQKFVTGRYAYAMYDEGGLLDMNATGYPNLGGTSDPGNAYKAGLPFADLTQIPGISNLTASRQATVINDIVGWRNSASGQATGSLVGGYTFATPTPNPGTNPGPSPWPYTVAMLGNPHAFLQTANTALFKGQTDRQLASRQELISLLLEGVAPSGAAGQTDRANLQNALQYFGTFSRSLNQPSFAPLPASANPDATHRPAVVAAAKGGNSAAGLSADDLINPSFLGTRVVTAKSKGRYDGTDFTAGDPLVKKRFALNRLAWLTYVGPIAQAGSPATYNPAVPTSYITALKNTYGFTDAFLLQGTPTNVLNYFGLSWKKDTNTSTSVKTDASGNLQADNQYKWFYNNHLYAPTGTGSKGPIMRLGQISALPTTTIHEPDFFEILKAAISVGSLGKSTRTTASDGDPQYARDIDVDAQVMQIGANIIDQFDLDGFPTQIIYDNGSGPVATYGVENLPYIYRIRNTYWKVRMSAPDTSSYYSGASIAGGGYWVSTSGTSSDDQKTGGQTLCVGPDHMSKPPSLTNTGVVYLMGVPDLWNPHDVDSTRGAAGVTDATGNPIFPTSFRVVAQSSAFGVSPGAFFAFAQSGRVGDLKLSNSYVDSATLHFPVYEGYNGDSTGWDNHPRKITAANSGMYFSIQNTSAANGLFREPTMLFKIGLGNGTGLTGKDSTGNGEDNCIVTPQKANNDGNLNLYAGAGGVQVDAALDTGYNYNSNLEPQKGQTYLGIYYGAIPLACDVTPAASPMGTENRTWGTVQNANGTGYVTYMMQCLVNGSWVTYDVKYAGLPYGGFDLFNNNVQDGSEWPHCHIGGYQGGNTNRFFDPRTPRFGAYSDGAGSRDVPPWASWPTTSSQSWAGALGVLSGVLDNVNGVTCADRPDNESGRQTDGWSGSYFSTAGGWYPGGPGLNSMRPGLFSQNRSDVFNDNKAESTDTASPPSPIAGQYYTDADGVLRRAMGADVKPDGAGMRPAATSTGLAEAMGGGTLANGSESGKPQTASRPFILNRPFQSVTELGYTFSGTPWKNLSFFTPESGSSVLLDVFCVSDSDNTDGLVAGKVNLNTRQAPVLQALLSGGYKDEVAYFPTSPAGYTQVPALTSADAVNIASALVQRTAVGGTTASTTPGGPLTNLASLVGTYSSYQALTNSTSPPVASGAVAPNNIDGSKSYDGLSRDLDTITFAADGTATTNIQRFRESALRPLANAGQTRVWNVLIDVIAQTGRYPQTASSLTQFSVDGEQRYWVHLAIDRFSGTIIDKYIEPVKE